VGSLVSAIVALILVSILVVSIIPILMNYVEYLRKYTAKYETEYEKFRQGLEVWTLQTIENFPGQLVEISDVGYLGVVTLEDGTKFVKWFPK